MAALVDMRYRLPVEVARRWPSLSVIRANQLIAAEHRALTIGSVMVNDRYRTRTATSTVWGASGSPTVFCDEGGTLMSAARTFSAWNVDSQQCNAQRPVTRFEFFTAYCKFVEDVPEEFEQYFTFLFIEDLIPKEAADNEFYQDFGANFPVENVVPLEVGFLSGSPWVRDGLIVRLQNHNTALRVQAKLQGWAFDRKMITSIEFLEGLDPSKRHVMWCPSVLQ
eukprot:TRINITY_DN81152_c0_g1_i1.p1 TRINITY_DN81152_c0_g1~~TRINITY_DN81152_c0_g1_i1.p1  ORF type:complete len:243 (-),score=32.94 TRINITY_DN81152_c0_g1_i1:104-772(-)